MATILKPTKDYFVDNCQCLTRPVGMTDDKHPLGYDVYPQFFVYELFAGTRVNVEVPSDNNPVSIYHTGLIRE